MTRVRRSFGRASSELVEAIIKRGLTPEAYRAKWGLPADYPMVTTSYSAKRSELAKSLGLGQQRRKSAPEEAGNDPNVGNDPDEA